MTERGRFFTAVSSFAMALALVVVTQSPAEAKQRVDCNGTNSAKCQNGNNEHDFGLFGGSVYLCSPNDCHWTYLTGYCFEYHSTCDE